MVNSRSLCCRLSRLSSSDFSELRELRAGLCLSRLGQLSDQLRLIQVGAVLRLIADVTCRLDLAYCRGDASGRERLVLRRLLHGGVSPVAW